MNITDTNGPAFTTNITIGLRKFYIFLHFYKKRVLIDFDIIDVVIFKQSSSHESVYLKWELILGKLYGVPIVINSMGPKMVRFDQQHSKNYFKSLKRGFRLIILDNLIILKKMEYDEVFIEFWSEKIFKNDFMYLFALENSQNDGCALLSQPITTKTSITPENLRLNEIQIEAFPNMLRGLDKLKFSNVTFFLRPV